MIPHRAFAMHEATQVGEARRHAARLAAEAGFDEVAAGRLAIVVNELGNNLVRHAREGRLLLALVPFGAAAGPVPAVGTRPCVEVIALDAGPGIADLPRCYADGYSTGGTPGTGLGAVRRLSQWFDAFSHPGIGTVMVARLAPEGLSAGPARGALEVGGVCLPAPGEWVSGDAWSAQLRGDEGRIVVVDGLGHGPEAALAADRAIEVFEQGRDQPVDRVVEQMHAHLRGSRGAAASLVAFQADGQALTVGGAGNVLCRVISGTRDRTLVTPHGTLGLQVRRTPSLAAEWPEHALVVIHTDGVATRWSLAEVPGLMHRSAVVIAAWIVHHHLRGRDDATVVVLKRP